MNMSFVYDKGNMNGPFNPVFFGFTNWLSYIFFYVLENFVMYFMNSS